jgi:3'(2'), 5'-bisphosphate nucleotidase
MRDMKPLDTVFPQDLNALVEPLLALSQEAGRLICRHYHSAEAMAVESKADDTPLTRADLESHQVLVSGLRRLAPDIPILSEESTPEELAGRREWTIFWLIDPLDGTKEFLGRTGEFTINIALVLGDRPILGLIYRPLEDLAWVGIPGQGAWRYRMSETSAPVPLACRELRTGRAMAVLASRRHRGRRLGDCLSWLEHNWGSLERDNSGSALKFCQLAAGKGDFYPRFSLCSEWDVAAGDALVAAAGGAVLGLDGKPLRYNQRDTLLSENFIALADPGHPLWAEFLAQWRA